MQDDEIVVVSVVRDHTMYDRYIRNNTFFGFHKVVLDNSIENLPIPVRYNQFLDSEKYGNDVWILFCHEDFELQESILPLLDSLDRESIYGAVGSKRVGVCGLGMQYVYGCMTECNRNGMGKVWNPGHLARTGKCVETLDCCSLLVHSSVIRKYGLRFDGNLEYDLYVEDFCAMAKMKHGLRSRILSVKSCHHSGSRPTERLYRHLPYLRSKYPNCCFSATCVYFGTPSFVMQIQNILVDAIRLFT